MQDRLQFAETYSRLADDELARLALSNQLVPEAQEALTLELQKRGLTNLHEYKHALEEAAAKRSMTYNRKLLIALLVFMAAAAVNWHFGFVLPRFSRFIAAISVTVTGIYVKRVVSTRRSS